MRAQVLFLVVLLAVAMCSKKPAETPSLPQPLKSEIVPIGPQE